MLNGKHLIGLLTISCWPIFIFVVWF